VGGEASEEVSIHIDLSTVLSFPLMSLTRLGMLMNIFRSLLPFLLVILIILAVSPSDSAATILDGTVVSVSDGDTITVLDSDKVQHRVRIAGIDAPEKGQAFGNAFISTKQEGPVPTVSFPQHCFTPLMER